jgi:hypothetical protein
MTRHVKVLNDFPMPGRVRGGSSNAWETANVILPPSTNDESKMAAFSTNINGDDEIDLGRREAKDWV